MLFKWIHLVDSVPGQCSSGWIRNKNRIHPVYNISPSAPVLKAWRTAKRIYISQGVCRSPSVCQSVCLSFFLKDPLVTQGSNWTVGVHSPAKGQPFITVTPNERIQTSLFRLSPLPSFFCALFSLFLFQHPVFSLLSDRNSLAGEEEGKRKSGPLARSARLQLGQLSHAVDQAALCVCGGDLSGDSGRSQDLEGERPWPQECLAPKLLL